MQHVKWSKIRKLSPGFMNFACDRDVWSTLSKVSSKPKFQNLVQNWLYLQIFRKSNSIIKVKTGAAIFPRNNPACVANIYLFKASKGDTRINFNIRSKLTMKTPERRQWRRSGISLLLTLNKFHRLFWLWTSKGGLGGLKHPHWYP